MNKEKLNGLFWARTLLESYNKLPSMIGALNKASDAIIKTSLMTGSLACPYTTEEIYDKMIELNYRKAGIVNLKVLVDEALRRIPSGIAEVLRSKFISGHAAEAMALSKEVTTRTVFRKIDRGTELVYQVISSLGFNAKRLDAEYENEPLIMRQRKMIEEKYAELFEEKFTQSPRNRPVCA